MAVRAALGRTVRWADATAAAASLPSALLAAAAALVASGGLCHVVSPVSLRVGVSRQHATARAKRTQTHRLWKY